MVFKSFMFLVSLLLCLTSGFKVDAGIKALLSGGAPNEITNNFGLATTYGLLAIVIAIYVANET